MENSPGKKRVASGIITPHLPSGRRVGGVLHMLGSGWGTPRLELQPTEVSEHGFN